MSIEIRVVVDLAPELREFLRALADHVAGAGKMVAGTAEQDRREGLPEVRTTGAPGPSPAADAGASPQVLPPSGERAAPAAAEVLGEGWRKRRPFWRSNGLDYRTPERNALLRAAWPTAEPLYSVHARLLAVAGPRMPESPKGLYRWAEALELGDRTGHAQVRDRSLGWRTAEREALLRALWVEAIPLREVYARMGALPGPALPPHFANAYRWAQKLRLPARPVEQLKAEAIQRGRAAKGWNTGAGVAGSAEPVGPPTEAGGMTPVKVAEEEADEGAGVPDTPSAADSAPQLIGRPPNTGGEAEGDRRKPAAAQRPPAPPEPPSAPPLRQLAPRLPAPAGDGLIYAGFHEIKAWAAHFGIAYNGGNVDAVNRRRALMKLPPVVQDDARTRGVAA